MQLLQASRIDQAKLLPQKWGTEAQNMSVLSQNLSGCRAELSATWGWEAVPTSEWTRRKQRPQPLKGMG